MSLNLGYVGNNVLESRTADCCYDIPGMPGIESMGGIVIAHLVDELMSVHFFSIIEGVLVGRGIELFFMLGNHRTYSL